MEKPYKVQPIGIKYICDKCLNGEMFPTGKNNWFSDPPLIEHICNKCSQIDNFNEKYPLVRFMDKKI